MTLTIKVAGNQLAPNPPDRDAAGITAQEFAQSLFEFEYCAECHRDADKHTAVIGPTGHWLCICDPVALTCCIADGCGRRYDSDIPETRDASTLRSFWQRYCPECRTKGNASAEIITEMPAHPTHYIAGSGEYGCLYDSCSVYRTLQDAVNGLADTFELGRTRKASLKRNRRLDLNPSRDGADYCEITACTCATPWIHDETQSEDDWQ